MITRQNADADRPKSSLDEDTQYTRRNDFRYHTTDDITQKQDEQTDAVDEYYEYETITVFKPESPVSHVDNDNTITRQNAEVDRRKSSDEEAQDTRTRDYRYRTIDMWVTQKENKEADDVDEYYEYQTITIFKPGSPTSQVDNDKKITRHNGEVDRRVSGSA
ncbi:unnamed protein product [Didymodactylos carnosus]|uniref:Uncharacterized protein n=1 Tax=Didymodactylos carnosus TaxID=1234261 RepID=A0A8S2F9M4_9BILA|nr:unnamed protein product [Didymodactylos carnosus]CAF4198669.1 unnamed protein product [Didymodactylos carnosus]